MDKIWYILVDGKEEGPYSVHDLRMHPGFTPDTMARKEGSRRWMLARYISELKQVFKDDEPEEDEVPTAFARIPPSDELAIDYREDPPQFYLWLILTLTLLIYIFFRFFET